MLQMNNYIIEIPYNGGVRTYFTNSGKIAYSDMTTFEEYQWANQHLKLKEVTPEELEKLNNEFWESDWQEITKEEFWDLLECLPPERWKDLNENLNMFFCSEASAYSFHACSIHDRLNDKYYQASKNIFWSDAQILESFLNSIK